VEEQQLKISSASGIHVEERFGKYAKMAAQSKMADFRFPFCKLLCVKKYSKMVAKNQDGINLKKNLTKCLLNSPLVRQNGRKIQNGVVNLCFRIFALKGTISFQYQNPFLHLKCIFHTNFSGRIFFGKSKWPELSSKLAVM
jgi:hypothetical protein